MHCTYILILFNTMENITPISKTNSPSLYSELIFENGYLLCISQNKLYFTKSWVFQNFSDITKACPSIFLPIVQYSNFGFLTKVFSFQISYPPEIRRSKLVCLHGQITLSASLRATKLEIQRPLTLPPSAQPQPMCLSKTQIM